MNNHIHQLYENQEIIGNYHPLVGIIGNDRQTIFWTEHKLFTDAINIYNANATTGKHISKRIWGNYFGKEMWHCTLRNIPSTILCNNFQTFTTDMHSSWNKINYNETTNDKLSIFLMISQKGDFAQNINAISSTFKTHAQIFVARHTQDNHRTYYCIDPLFPLHNQSTKPLEFINKQKNLRHSNIISMIHGNQITTDDCFYRVLQLIDQIVSGNFDFESNIHCKYNLSTKSFQFQQLQQKWS